MMDFGFKIGEQLPNGATLLQVKADGIAGKTVLAIIHGEFVTWRAGNDGMTYGGHYFNGDLPKALEDFTQR